MLSSRRGNKLLACSSASPWHRCAVRPWRTPAGRERASVYASRHVSWTLDNPERYVVNLARVVGRVPHKPITVALGAGLANA
jgi:hypothetical protein